jgi:hypothetical protein
MNPIYVSWIRFQRRPVSMADRFGYETVFMPIHGRSLPGKLLSYVANFARTVSLLLRRRPDTVWVQVPQYPALWAAMVYRLLSPGRGVRIVADCHNSVAWRPWTKVPLGLSILPKCDVVLVHNDEVKQQVIGLGVPDRNLLVLEDAPASLRGEGVPPKDGPPRPWVLFPCAFAHDEPIAQVVEAARRMPDVTVLLTGDPDRGVARFDRTNLPPNLRLLGFLPLAEFDGWLQAADVIMALTLEEGIQMSVCNEAVGVGRPMVCSRTAILTDLFPKGTVFVDADSPESIAQGCLEALAERGRLTAEMVAFREERSRNWEERQARPVAALLARSAPLPAGSDPAGLAR